MHRPLSDGGWVATHEDITERTRQEQETFKQAAELARINMQFDAALSNMAQGLCMFDGEKRLVVWNERYAELYRLPPELLKVGTPHDAIIADRIFTRYSQGRDEQFGGQAEDCFIESAPERCRFQQGRRIFRWALHPGYPTADGRRRLAGYA